MLTPVDFTNWIVFVPSREAQYVDTLVEQMKIAGRAININVTSPVAV